MGKIKAERRFFEPFKGESGDAPSPRYARERATLVLLRFVRSDWSWESDLLNQALQPHGAGNALRGTEMGSERTLALL